MEVIGKHKRAELQSTKDINGRYMITCRDCETTAHAVEVSMAKVQLKLAACNPDCQNCKNLRHSYDGKPAVPIGGTCNTVLHECPNDWNKWWQSNTHFHLWQQVTDIREWKSLRRQQERDHLACSRVRQMITSYSMNYDIRKGG